MRHPTYGRLAEYARRAGIPINDPLQQARDRLAEVRSAQGAAIAGVYHPPLWDVEVIDGVIQRVQCHHIAPRRLNNWPWVLYGVVAACVVAFAGWAAFQ